MKTRAFVVAASIVCVTAIAVSCDKSPSRPSPSVPSSPQPVVTNLRIDGPSSVPPGESAQFTAVADYSDGSTRDVTREASWFSTNPTVLQVSSTGMATGIARGTAEVRVQFSGRTVRREVVVLPRGTYRLAGRVAESGFSIALATVSVTDGPAAGLSTTTDFNGFYALYGIAGDVEIRVSKDGYHPHVQRISVTDNRTVDFELVPVRRLEIAGNYLLTITAGQCQSPASRGVLPDAAKVRTYRVSVSQDGARLQVTLIGANLFGRGKFNGRVAPDVVTFTLYGPSDYYYYYYSPRTPDLGERLSDSQFLTISGEVQARGTDAGVTGTLNGLLRIGEGSSPPGTRTVDCWSPAHQFSMAK